MISIPQLEYIVAIDTYRHFVTAADKCFVTQPTLSMQIKKIEEELEVLIFDRSKKPVLTTDIGHLLIGQARETIRQFRKITEIVENQKDEISGELRVGIIPTLSPYLLPLFISKYRQHSIMQLENRLRVVIMKTALFKKLYLAQLFSLLLGVLASLLRGFHGMAITNHCVLKIKIRDLFLFLFTTKGWWVNDVKLNGAAITTLIYLAYRILRNSLQEEHQKAKISAVYNIFAFVMMIVLLMIMPRITDSLHPGNGGNPAFGKYDLDDTLRMVFYPAVLGWILLGMWMLHLKKRLYNLENKLEND